MKKRKFFVMIRRFFGEQKGFGLVKPRLEWTKANSISNLSVPLWNVTSIEESKLKHCLRPTEKIIYNFDEIILTGNFDVMFQLGNLQLLIRYLFTPDKHNFFQIWEIKGPRATLHIKAGLWG